MTTYRFLKDAFNPSNYNLQLQLDRTGRTFAGQVVVSGELPQAADQIVLHAKDLRVTKASINGEAVEFDEQPNASDEISLRKAGLQPGDYQLQLEFTGQITDPMNGLYPCKTTVNGQPVEILATQFESHDARAVFPCIDEPAAKATFDVTLTTEPDIEVIGNTPIKQQTKTGNTLVTTFETTPIMSTYLLAFVAGPLAYKEATTKDGIAVRVYTTQDKLQQVDFALDTATRALEFYNDYFGVPYPLQKCDLIALPDFSSGAMENWGCITFRESVLLVDPQNTPLANKQFVALVVAHELAHQWFGNLVTMQWWDDLWLNESFANWMEYYVTDKLYPEWQIWLQFYAQETAGALDKDALASVQKVRQSVNHPDEIRTLFDGAIVYAKGGSLLRMLHAHIGDDDFRKGLQTYMQRFAYKNTIMDDLLDTWGEASGKDVKGFMQPWVLSAGHPLVSVAVKDGSVELRQRRFYSNPQQAAQAQNTAQTWPIPLLAGDALRGEIVDQASATLAYSPSQAPLQLNHERAGFYQISYDQAHIHKLADAVRDGKVEVLDRLGLLNDSYDLARAGVDSARQMLTLLDAYRHESVEPVWSAIRDCIGALQMFVDDDEALRAQLRQFVGALVQEQFERLGWDKNPGEPHFDELLRPAIVSLMCYSEQPEVIAHARQLFAAAGSPEDIRADIRRAVCAVAAKLGTPDDFEKLLDWHHQTTSAQIRTQMIAALTATKDREHIKRLLDMLTTNEVKLQDVFYWFAYLARNRHAKDLVWQWMQDNWDWITDNFGGDMHYDDFPSYSAAGLSRPQDLTRYKAFFDPMRDHPALSRSIKQAVEGIEARILWCQRDEADVIAYLHGQTGE